jgi:2-C-methyl-D-erythritol 4-phosphate cytidylyltransferase/2-C-methyl-D-erythritol 2,4-cyclodiphosphate synthase
MGGIDKVTAPLLGRPLLSWTLDAIAAAGAVRRIVVVAAPERVDELADAEWLRRTGATVVPGGARRQESVAAGVAATDAPLVLVHDGARPLVTASLVDAVAAAVRQHGAAIPVLPVAETLKQVGGSRVLGTVARDGLAAAQTPQGARRDVLLDAFAAHDPTGVEEFTDEAGLLERQGHVVATVEGEATNIKVTRAEDLDRAAAVLVARGSGAGEPPRTGRGSDIHPFGPEDGLALGGILIPEAPRLHGHSDGDVVLHAIADALLGAARVGDLGRLFPAGDPRTRGIASTELLAAVVSRLGESGWRPATVDVTLIGARPRLGGARLDRMRDGIAALLAIDPGAVSVNASTGNLIGPEGRGLAISATAYVSVVRR